MDFEALPQLVEMSPEVAVHVFVGVGAGAGAVEVDAVVLFVVGGALFVDLFAYVEFVLVVVYVLVAAVVVEVVAIVG